MKAAAIAVVAFALLVTTALGQQTGLSHQFTPLGLTDIGKLKKGERVIHQKVTIKTSRPSAEPADPENFATRMIRT